MGLLVATFSSILMFGTYTFLFKEDFTKELLDKVLVAAIVIVVLILLFSVT